MITIIEKSAFKTFPWKNGQGETLELAINDNGNMSNFDWRISMAKVVNDGKFSNFSGYDRQLVLIAGNAIELNHDDVKQDLLNNLLDFACFDGGSHTVATLPNGPITDFNIITKRDDVSSHISVYRQKQKITLAYADVVFVYSIAGECIINGKDGNIELVLKRGDLAKFEQFSNEEYIVEGGSLIVVYINFK